MPTFSAFDGQQLLVVEGLGRCQSDRGLWTYTVTSFNTRLKQQQRQKTGDAVEQFLVVDVPGIMQRQVPASAVQTVQETVEFAQLHSCGRPCAHAAKSLDFCGALDGQQLLVVEGSGGGGVGGSLGSQVTPPPIGLSDSLQRRCWILKVASYLWNIDGKHVVCGPGVTQETGVTENERASSRTSHILSERWKAPTVTRIWTLRPMFRKNENQPSSQEVQEHMKTHIPYRSWCAHCVRGRVRNDPHRSGGGGRGPSDHPHLAIDDGFLKANNPNDPADQGSKPILTGAEAKCGLTLAMAVPGKGNAAPWIAKRVVDWLDWLGSQTVTMKCDNEPAILALAQEIRRLRRESSITILEHPEEGEKQSNHLAEGGVNIVKGLIRTLKSSTESNLRTEIGPSHPLIPWIKEHAAQLKNRYMVGADGRTPTERVRGRGVQRPVYELGEKVLFLPLAPARRGDFGARFDYGIYLNCRSFDGQAYVGTPSG